MERPLLAAWRHLAALRRSRPSESELDRQLAEARRAEAEAQARLEHTRETIIAPAQEHVRQNNFAAVLRDSLAIGYGRRKP